MSAKEAVLEMIRKMPDDVTEEDILYELYVRQRIKEGLRQLDAGEGIPHEEAMKRLSRWLK
jgi:predicted transcriptional regulator